MFTRKAFFSLILLNLSLLQHLQFASLLGDESVQREDEKDRGDASQSRWSQVLKREQCKKLRFMITRRYTYTANWLHGCGEKLKPGKETDLPEKEEAEGNLDGSEPHGVKVHDKIHELLGVRRDQIHNLSYCTLPPCCAVYHQRLHRGRQTENRSLRKPDRIDLTINMLPLIN